MCAGQDLIKQGGVYVCLNCGTKYTTEEAQKLMVEIQGSVKVDRSTELTNLRTLATRALNERNLANAQKYFEQILLLDPDSWDANIFSSIYAAQNSTTPQIHARAVIGRLSTSLPRLKTDVNSNDYESWLTIIKDDLIQLANKLYNISSNEFAAIVNDSKGKYQSSAQKQQTQDRVKNASMVFDNAVLILTTFGDIVESEFGPQYSSIAVSAYKHSVELYRCVQGISGVSLNDEKTEQLNKIVAKIQQHEPDYQQPKRGCYVATSVYGSYDCPQVWTLRRYRDYTLAETCLGRLFIRTYYAVSPTIVKWFGNAAWFKRIWRKRLDKMVAKLNSQGVEDTPYNDRMW